MRTANPLLTRLVIKAMKPRNTVLAAMKDRHGGAGPHRKTRGALRRAENMAVAQQLRAADEENSDA